jgi:hypothetical protein
MQDRVVTGVMLLLVRLVPDVLYRTYTMVDDLV